MKFLKEIKKAFSPDKLEEAIERILDTYNKEDIRKEQVNVNLNHFDSIEKIEVMLSEINEIKRFKELKKRNLIELQDIDEIENWNDKDIENGFRTVGKMENTIYYRFEMGELLKLVHNTNGVYERFTKRIKGYKKLKKDEIDAKSTPSI